MNNVKQEIRGSVVFFNVMPGMICDTPIFHRPLKLIAKDTNFIDAGMFSLKSANEEVTDRFKSIQDIKKSKCNGKDVVIGIKLTEDYKNLVKKLPRKVRTMPLKQQVEFLTSKGYHVMFRNRFQDKNSTDFEQVYALKTLVNKVVGKETDINMMGNSRAGIFSYGYACLGDKRLKNITTVGTPYYMDKYIKDMAEKVEKMIDKNAENSLKGFHGVVKFTNNVRETWNSISPSEKPKAHAIGVDFFKKPNRYSTDGVVSLKAQLNYNADASQNFRDVNRYIVSNNKDGEDISTLNHVMEMQNERVQCLIKNIVNNNDKFLEMHQLKSPILKSPLQMNTTHIRVRSQEMTM